MLVLICGTQPLPRLPCTTESRAKSTESITITPSKSHKTLMAPRERCCWVVFFLISKTVKFKWPDHSQAIPLLCAFSILNMLWSCLLRRNGALQFSCPVPCVGSPTDVQLDQTLPYLQPCRCLQGFQLIPSGK